MIRILDSPFLVFIVSLLAQWSAAYVGDVLRRTVKPVKTEARADLDTVLTATLTLLALIIGFTFSMAVSRYDLRKKAAWSVSSVRAAMSLARLWRDQGKVQQAREPVAPVLRVV